ncbi:hypothetical protein [Nostoc sp.]
MDTEYLKTFLLIKSHLFFANAPCPMPNAQCPMPNAQFLFFHPIA